MTDELSDFVSRETIRRFRDEATEEEPDAIAVIVLSGTPERGLVIQMSSHKEVDDTMNLLAYAMAAQGDEVLREDQGREAVVGLSFDDYCTEHNIQEHEKPAAFAAFLNQQTGWDGDVKKVEEGP